MRRRWLGGTLAASLVLAGGLVLVGGIARAADPPTNAEDVRPLMIGASVPDAQVGNLEGENVGLLDVMGDKPTMLVFYRGGW